MIASAAAPSRSHEQRMKALEKANGVRSYRARVKVDVHERRRPAHEVVAMPEEELATMKVADLLLAVPSVGRVKMQKTLARARVSPSKTLGGLTERQRRELIAVLPRAARG